jgi:hypothetical protein
MKVVLNELHCHCVDWIHPDQVGSIGGFLRNMIVEYESLKDQIFLAKLTVISISSTTLRYGVP